MDATTNKPQPVIDTIEQTITDLRRLRPEIERALKYSHGTHTYDDVCGMVLIGRLKFWPLKRSFMLTEILEYPRKRCYHIFLAGGELEELKAMQSEVAAEAQALNCQRLTLSGRGGWVRALQGQGWKPGHVTCYFDLEE